MCTRLSPQAKKHKIEHIFIRAIFSQLIFIPLIFIFIYNVYNFPSNEARNFMKSIPSGKGSASAGISRWCSRDQSMRTPKIKKKKRFSESTIEQRGESWRVLCFQVITRQIHESDEIVLEFQLKPIDPLDISRLGFPSTIHFSCLVSRESGIHFNIDETISKKNERRKEKFEWEEISLLWGNSRGSREMLMENCWSFPSRNGKLLLGWARP